MSTAFHLLWLAYQTTLSSPLPPSIPVGNITQLNEEIAPAWMSPADFRGTMDILYTCLVTLSLCVYSAVHINVPPHGASKRWCYLQMSKWTVLGIFAPEVVLFTAGDQFWKANQLRKALNKEANRQFDDPTSAFMNIALGNRTARKVPNHASSAKDSADAPITFSLAYCFYVVMGGFVLNLQEVDANRSLTITPEGVLGLASRGQLLLIDESEISDKSKADILAKGLVCFQVSWMLIQCIARKAAGYPLPILELHTLVHVACALVMYGLWFKKPLNISEPTLVTGPVGDEWLDYAVLGSMTTRNLAFVRTDIENGKPVKYRLAAFFAEIETIHTPDGDVEADPGLRSFSLSPSEKSFCSRTLTVEPSPEDGIPCEIFVSGDELPCGFPLAVFEIDYHCSPECGGRDHKARLLIAKKDLPRWERAGRALRSILLASQTPLPRHPAKPRCQHSMVQDASNVVGGTEEADVEISQICSACRPVRTATTVDVQSDEGAADCPQKLSIEEIISSDDLPQPAKLSASGQTMKPSSDSKSTDSSPRWIDQICRDKYLCSRARNNDGVNFNLVLEMLLGNDDHQIRNYSSWFLAILLVVLMTAYGGIHMSAWNYDFPSTVERWLWRSSCIAIMAVGWVWLLVGVGTVSIRTDWEGDSGSSRLLAWAGGFLLLVGFSIPCVFARVFIVVQSFISLRAVPIGVYAEVPWANYIPHI